MERIERIEELELNAYNLIPTLIKSEQAKGKFRTLRSDADDLFADCFLTLKERNYFAEYDPSKGVSFPAYLRVAVQRWLIDQTRSISKLDYVHVSLDAPVDDGDIDEEDSRTGYNFYATGNEANNCQYVEALKNEILRELDDTDLVSRTGVSRSDRKLFTYVYAGYNVAELARMWGITPIAVKNHLDRVRDEIKEMFRPNI